MKNIVSLILLVVIFSSCKKNNTTQSPSNNTTPTPTTACSFTAGNGLTDIDGNTYTTVIIGNQEWMAQNLKVSKYRNGISIPTVTDSALWRYSTSGACCYQQNLLTNKNIYGMLYNWMVTTNTNNIAPIGWHVPTTAEWNILINNMGGNTIAGDKLKEAGTLHWASPSNGNNCSGFNALPGGDRFIGQFKSLNTKGAWWTSTPNGAGYANVVTMGNSTANVYSNDFYNEEDGLYIRLVKD